MHLSSSQKQFISLGKGTPQKGWHQQQRGDHIHPTVLNSLSHTHTHFSLKFTS